jgi:molecular chaperone HscB
LTALARWAQTDKHASDAASTMIDFSRNHYELFELPERFELDPAALEQAYHRAQSAIHPDRYAHAGETEQRLALQLSAQVNEAYRTLKNPVARATYLLALHDVDAFAESDTAMPPDFLLTQMQWREELADARGARDTASLDRLASDVREQAAALDRRIAELIDVRQAWDNARLLVRQRKFLEKLAADISDATAELDD